MLSPINCAPISTHALASLTFVIPLILILNGFIVKMTKIEGEMINDEAGMTWSHGALRRRMQHGSNPEERFRDQAHASKSRLSGNCGNRAPEDDAKTLGFAIRSR